MHMRRAGDDEDAALDVLSAQVGRKIDGHADGEELVALAMDNKCRC